MGAGEVIVFLQSQFGIEVHRGLYIDDEEVTEDEVAVCDRWEADAAGDVAGGQNPCQFGTASDVLPVVLHVPLLSRPQPRQQEASGRDGRDLELAATLREPVRFAFVLDDGFFEGSIVHPPRDIVRDLAASLVQLPSLLERLVAGSTQRATILHSVKTKAPVLLETALVDIPLRLHSSSLQRFMHNHTALDAKRCPCASGADDTEVNVRGWG
mmetsp:Transcript_21900/g.32749  ORF Transcript_21900/g.32749 Transcript_21900/m.32749 type:complete len:212 (+) Transcript_21900:666-1301(+)